MIFKEVAEVCAAIIVSLGGGAGIVYGLSGYLGKLWAVRALERQRHEYAQLNIELTHQLELVTRRVQIELDTLGYLHKLRTESEFQKVRELWKRIANVRDSFIALPQMGLSLQPTQPGTAHEYNVQLSNEFIDAVGEALDLLNVETLSIPKRIAGDAYGLLNIAQREALKAHACPDPYYSDTDRLFSTSQAKTDYLSERSNNQNDFNTKAVQLEATMREYLSGGKGDCLPQQGANHEHEDQGEEH